MNSNMIVKTGYAALATFGFLFWGIFFSTPTPAENFILDKGIWVDQEGTASLMDARAQEYSSFKGDIAAGFLSGAQWIRLQTRAHPEELLLFVWPLWLDRIEVFTTDDDIPLAVLGARQRDTTQKATILGRAIILPASDAATVWLRVETATTNFVSTSIFAPHEAIGEVFRLTVKVTIHLVGLALLISAGLLAWLIVRDQLFFAFAIHQTVFMLYVMDFYGMTQLAVEALFETAVAPFLHAALTFLVVTGFVGYEAIFIARYKAARLLVWTLALLATIPALLFCLWLFGARDLAFAINAAVYLASLPVLLAAALSAKEARNAAPPLGRGVLVSYVTLVLASVFMTSKTVLGGAATPRLALYWFNLGHGTLLGIIMLSMLLYALKVDFITRSRIQQERDQAIARHRDERVRADEKSRFLHMLMHELNTPLAVATFVLSLPVRNDKAIEQARKAMSNMKSIIDRCIQDAQVGAGVMVPHWKEVNLLALIDDLVDAYPSLAARITRSEPTSDVVLQSDPQLLRIILANLLENAEKYSLPGSCVGIAVTDEAHSNSHTFGIFISNQPSNDNWPDPSKLFNRFYRSDRANRISGSGIGLHLSRELARLLEGDLTYEKIGKEAVFTLWVPRYPASR